jgi:hypothetical protein
MLHPSMNGRCLSASWALDLDCVFPVESLVPNTGPKNTRSACRICPKSGGRLVPREDAFLGGSSGRADCALAGETWRRVGSRDGPRGFPARLIAATGLESSGFRRGALSFGVGRRPGRTYARRAAEVSAGPHVVSPPTLPETGRAGTFVRNFAANPTSSQAASGVAW